MEPENMPSQKERIVFQPAFFRGYVKLREGMFLFLKGKIPLKHHSFFSFHLQNLGLFNHCLINHRIKTHEASVGLLTV